VEDIQLPDRPAEYKAYKKRDKAEDGQQAFLFTQTEQEGEGEQLERMQQ
jgi:hypothetical protein